jgi:hypothetical protein
MAALVSLFTTLAPNPSFERLVEFYETEAGQCPVRKFLDELKAAWRDMAPAVRLHASHL